MITVYTTKTCAYCPLVKKYLTEKNIDYNVVDVTDDPDTRQELFEKTGLMQVPVTVSDNDFVVGFQPSLLAKLVS